MGHMPNSGQFEPGNDTGGVGNRGRGRPSYLSDPENVKNVAEAFSIGMSREDMCDTFGVSDPGTITRWRKDARVKAAVRKIVNDRILRISSKTDHVIEGRLAQATDMTIDELIKIRKEYGGSALARTDASDDAIINEAMEALEENPQLLDQLKEVLSRAQIAPMPEGDEEIVVPDDASELVAQEA
jgi:hypothetical protein